MTKLTRESLWSLEEYSNRRNDFRTEVMAHKKDRQLNLGEHVRLLFEDEKTIRYQVQEMLRIEKVFDAEGIQDELDAYNPLIPDGSNWKATMMIEYHDVDERKRQLARLIGIEDTVWLQVEGYAKVHPICNEDLERSTDEKTSSVHFMRFELSADMVSAARSGAAIMAGIDHDNYRVESFEIPEATRHSLVSDLSEVH
ncbi:MAG: DUF3501 family protein [Natronospirillum sp.]|uniref:DUF3501 family protein n=1 Tax=Natronospirillum sp. TaxID=2812955 RepID=UPI0025F6B202|nr:DUF3501 family protein [Natronospirillum sp.]MCH8552878.1 DUF3501 family protein [Natronospirillum sp.]